VRLYEPHALSATSRCGLEQDGEADRAGELVGSVHVFDGTVAAWSHRDTRLDGQLFGPGLLAHCGDRGGGWTDEDNPRFVKGAGKRRVLAQEAVARVHRVCAGAATGLDDLVDAEIRLIGCGWADVYRFVCRSH